MFCSKNLECVSALTSYLYRYPVNRNFSYLYAVQSVYLDNKKLGEDTCERLELEIQVKNHIFGSLVN
jgi:hypothetical protein